MSRHLLAVALLAGADEQRQIDGGTAYLLTNTPVSRTKQVAAIVEDYGMGTEPVVTIYRSRALAWAAWKGKGK